ncbi:TOMM precursor leader peptide-binding protein [Nocardia brasiliensis]|uniref:TOMM precursor leader peptide-binding protein n=1 Tax=Nocardia brasiliensis TaxID=37326 RepID=UPI001893621B|nr:TOMM precursor leader peptide-binding protein [Nocardia brasiliensis]MBF6131099.1 TOMM precursor leader peptide-binding protein [Nocardia brasiliensis]
MPHDIAVLGAGLLATAVRDAVAATGHCVRTADETPYDALIVADDTSAATAAASPAVPWFPLRLNHTRVLVGPGGFPGRPGCPTCADRRREHNRADAPQRAALSERFGADLLRRPSPLLLATTAAAAAALAVAEVEKLLTGAPNSVQWSLDLETAATTTHTVMADPLCPDCSDLPGDDPGIARNLFAPNTGRRGLRTRDLTAALPELQRIYVDADTGTIRELTTWTTVTSPVSRAAIESEQAPASSHGYGRGFGVDATKAAAVAEALERLGGQRPRGRRTTVRAAYTEVAGRAIDPRAFGLYSDARYDAPGFWFHRYHPDLEIPWVWAYSCARAEAVLVPECLAYYGVHDRRFAYETSNGCAVGSSLAEAALHGLLEVTERDAFLLTWYARLPVPRVDLDSATDRRIPLLADLVAHEFGYEVAAFDCTTETRVPAYWLMAVDQKPGENRPAVLCGAAAHVFPEHALLSGIQEMLTMLEGFVARYDPESARQMVADSDRVGAMDDHSTLYGHPDAFGRLGFLPLDGPRQPIPPAAWPEFADLTQDLGHLAERYRACDLDVLIVDQTSAEHRAGGFACAKVLVPGTVPMTFGHRNRRDHGLPRIRTAPRVLGYAEHDLGADEINPHPHPFP